MHTAAVAALKSTACQPGGAAELASCAAFWVLRRLLAREELPAALRQHIEDVVAAVTEALLSESGKRQGCVECVSCCV